MNGAQDALFDGAAGAAPTDQTPVVTGLHLSVLTASGSDTPPFIANCVTLTYNQDTVTTTGPIVATLTGINVGNGQIKLYPNSPECVCFADAIITGVTVVGLNTPDTVDLEYIQK